MTAFLNCVGKMPSLRARFISVVIGWSSASRQDFKRKVGMISSGQVVLEEDRMAVRTSSLEAGTKSERQGGAVDGADSVYIGRLVGNEEESFVVFSLK